MQETADSTLDLTTLLTELPEGNDAEAAIEIARRLLVRSRELLSSQERRQQAELDRMIGHPGDKATLIEMTDQAFRTHSPARVADQLTHILDLQGVPRFFSPLEQTMLRGFQSFGAYLPGVAVPLVKEKMRQETANVILPAEEEMLSAHLRARQDSGLQMNVNFLGEALLGEKEAERRLKHYLHAMQLEDVRCISVKISTIFSQISPIARRETIRVLGNRLELLYRAALRNDKFVYLDMEEYRDLHLTAEAFREALDRDGIESVRAGIALQAYLPDSFGVLESLLDWSRSRVASGKRAITVRLVKGANMEMERVEASVGGWPQTPYEHKCDTDANFKRMLESLVRSAAAGDVTVGVASHNLFDIALALLWGDRAGALERMQFEMLEGMANHQRRALFESAPRMLLYAPACRREDFLNAIGYLIRRLDENTGDENFLRHTFRLTPDSETWTRLAEGFSESLGRKETVDGNPRRTQDREREPAAPPAAKRWQDYRGEPDTDWSLPHHSGWAEAIVARWKQRCDEHAERVPLVVAGEDRSTGRDERTSCDPSRPDTVACRYVEAGEQDVEDAIRCAAEDSSGWRSWSWDRRYEVFRRAADHLRCRRADLIGAMMLGAGKLITEADPEVSEAIDFTEFYPLTMRPYTEQTRAVEFRPRGVVAVISPWNFPLAIPCGGVVAALAAGNTVILKPASDTVLPAYLLAQCFWDAGVPEAALQLIPCRGGGAGKRLVTDPRVDAVVLTGGTETARTMLKTRPGLHLIAETGGKNATIVTALADRDLAIKHVLHSAFGHSGQKCSATSLLLLQRELYDDELFRDALADAAESLRVGSAWELTSRVGPLIRPPSGELEKGIKELEAGEEWLLMPRNVGDNPHLYRPGIKWNVARGSFTHRTELFGPVLGVMPFGRLEEAIEMVNATGYGLTSGLESLDDREQALWSDNIRAGNLYINRPTTGAIVLRQPFGGLGSSGYGPGAKAGGPHYVLPLMRAENKPLPEEELAATDGALGDLVEALSAVAEGASEDWGGGGWHAFANQAARFRDEVLARRHDHFHLIGQDNLRRYLPVRQLRVRLTGSESIHDVVLSLIAAAAAECPVTYSFARKNSAETQLLEATLDHLSLHASTTWHPEWLEESDESLAAAISDGRVDRLRVLDPTDQLPGIVLDACREAFLTILSEPVASDAEVETIRYVNEQSISHDYHRYGNLGRRKT